MAVIALTGWLLTRPDPAPPAAGACIIAVDVDRGTAASHDHYRGWLQDIVRDCADDGDTPLIATIPISGRTTTTTTVPVVLDLAALNLPQNSLNRDRALDTAITQYLDDVDQSLDTADTTSSGTDIIGGFTVADGLLHQAGPGPRHLIVLTDGLNTAAGTNLTVLPLDPANRAALITRLSKDGLLPDITGTTVEFIGVNTGQDADQLPAERLQQIKTFWADYITAAGGNLTTYSKTTTR